ncbi:MULTISPECIES: hypothetical protein [Microbacterium]|uniref:hypothetical protein n=1 Tax=Microbacterium TaxID=33882 RepID=UPI00278A8994|nr:MULTISPECIES: hypothetical protein [Microbacterium]MDQ1083918.1 hypothetical protein [Microbacterium sp. SORGH_AS_0344]MDQ1170803.1 hypothetical protein [Microbacterium proteolyticum]
MRPTEKESVIESVTLVNNGLIPPNGSAVALLMAVRDDAKGSLLDLAHSVAHRERNEGGAYREIEAFAKLMLDGLLRKNTEGGRVKVLHPIREVINQMNLVLSKRDLGVRIDPRDQRARMTFAWSIAYALHETSFLLAGERRALLTLDQGDDGRPRMSVTVEFPELNPDPVGTIFIGFPWLLDEKDRLADWGQVSPVS